jgi:hypothetical protein
MVFTIQALLMALVIVGVSVLTWGARRLNLGQRSLTIALAMTTVSWIVFLVVTIVSLVSLSIQSSN